MCTITAILEPHEDGTLHLPLPADLKSGKIRVVASFEPAESSPSEQHPLLGIWQGQLAFAPDWDAPLDDFTGLYGIPLKVTKSAAQAV
jgi:hypothetical protein